MNDTTTVSAPASRRLCSISGVCRWVPPTPYAVAEPITSEPSRLVLAPLPAPDVPVAATTTTSSVADQPLGHRRRESQRGCGREAAGNGDPGRPGQHPALPGELGQPVVPRPCVGRPVEALPVGGVDQPMVGAAVEDDDVFAELGGQRGRVTVRQREEDDVVPREVRRRRLQQHSVGERHQLGLHGAQRRTGTAACCQRPDLDLRVRAEQSEQLTSDVPTGTGNGNLDHGKHTLSLDRLERSIVHGLSLGHKFIHLPGRGARLPQSWLSASTGAILAARRAGSTEASRPAPTATTATSASLLTGRASVGAWLVVPCNSVSVPAQP